MTTKITEKNISNITNFAVQWQSVHVADGSTALTATAGKGYFIDTTSGAQTVNIPSLDDSTLGDTIILKDFARQWGNNAITLGSNTFDGDTNTPTFSTEGQTVTLVFMGSTKGWSLINEDTTTTLGKQYISATGGTIATSGDFKVHTFTGDGCFVVSCGGNSAGSNTVDYLVVAGGGGGGRDCFGTYPSNRMGSGAGAGGFRMSNSYSLPGPTTSPLASPTGVTVTAQTYPISVGAGGSGGTPCASGPGIAVTGTKGSNSVFSTITSAGGGGGRGHSPGPPGGGPAPVAGPQTNGGSGGGGYSTNLYGGSPGPQVLAGAGNQPPVSPPQGNNGGAEIGPPGFGGSGGGGAGAAGTDSPGTLGTGAVGGIGSYVNPSFAGCNGEGSGPVSCVQYFAGGGGAWPANAGGHGGGGNGGGHPQTAAGSGNTGGGGGGNRLGNGGAGGKGIVILRYKFQN